MPGFWGLRNSSFKWSHAERPRTLTASNVAVTPTILLPWLISFRIEYCPRISVSQVQAEGEVRGSARRLEFILGLRLRRAVIGFRIDAGPRAPRVDVADAEHERRALLRTNARQRGVRQLPHRREIPELPELVATEVAERRLVARAGDCRTESLRDRCRLPVQRRRRILRVAAGGRPRVALEIVRAVENARTALVIDRRR